MQSRRESVGLLAVESCRCPQLPSVARNRFWFASHIQDSSLRNSRPANVSGPGVYQPTRHNSPNQLTHGNRTAGYLTIDCMTQVLEICEPLGTLVRLTRYRTGTTIFARSQKMRSNNTYRNRFRMTTHGITKSETKVARSLAPEDLRCGDFVAILSETREYLWSCDTHAMPPSQPVRLQWQAWDGGTPLKVKAICLPFVFVRTPRGKHQTLDIRQCQLVRLDPDYAKLVCAKSRRRNGRRRN